MLVNFTSIKKEPNFISITCTKFSNPYTPSYFSSMGADLFQFKHLYICGTKVETQKVQKAYILELIPIPFGPFASPNATNAPNCSLFFQV